MIIKRHRVRSSYEVRSIKDSMCLTRLPTHTQRNVPLWRRPPPLWMGVGRLVRRKEPLMVPTSEQPCCNYGATSQQICRISRLQKETVHSSLRILTRKWHEVFAPLSSMTCSLPKSSGFLLLAQEFLLASRFLGRTAKYSGFSLLAPRSAKMDPLAYHSRC